MMKKFLPLICLLVAQLIFSQQRKDFKPAEMSTGILPNGMHYYVMQNEEPKGRAAFYFAQNVGSILEEDDQRGLAHFLEHMAFNGTKNFPDKKMLQYLEQNGVKFGNEINAFTLYDETVYSIRNVPTANPKLIDSVLLILHDWAGSLTLADAEIDNERGVVHEEWRTRYNPQKRAKDSVQELGLLQGSKYADRSPIGLMEVIDNFEYETLRNYYKQWYRPDEQAVIVVGDFDEQEVVKEVKKLFGSIPLREDLPERPVFDVPLGDELTYLPIKDKELGVTSIEYYIKHKPDFALSEKESIERDLKLRMVNTILDRRFTALAAEPESPVFSSRFSNEEVVRSMEALKIDMQPKNDSLLAALQWAAIELKRFDLYGATEKEFERTKSSLQASFKRGMEKGGSSNVFHAIEIYKAFFDQKRLPDYSWEQEYQLDYLNTLTPADLLKTFKEYYSTEGNVVAILGSDALDYPSKGEVSEVLQIGRKANPKVYEEKVIEAKPLMKLDLPGSEIVEEKQFTDVDAKYFKLANGATVYLYKPISQMDGVYFKAISAGGRSVLPQELLENSLFATYFSAESGIANLTKEELRKSSELVMPSVKIEEYQEILDGYTNLENLEKLSKGIYLAFTQPRFDEKVFESSRQVLKRMVTMLQSSVQSNLSDSLQMAKANFSNREVHLNSKLLQNLTIPEMEKVYRDRITNAADFKFVFMGDVDQEDFKKLIKKYIGSIPGREKKEQIIDQNLRPELGIYKLHMQREMQTPQATVNIYLTGDLPYSAKNETMIQVIAQLLNKRYMEKIREEEGGTYGVRVKAGLLHLPNAHYELNISFNGNPDKTDRLVEIVYDELENLTKQVDNKAFEEVINNFKKAATELKDNNKSYFDAVMDHVENDTPILTLEQRLQMISQISVKDVLATAKKINKEKRVVEAILSPLNVDGE